MALSLVVSVLLALHHPENGDRTYSNPVMPNAHWSDPSVVQVDGTYYLVSSSIQTSPSIQILSSNKIPLIFLLVNVLGQMTCVRGWTSNRERREASCT